MKCLFTLFLAASVIYATAQDIPPVLYIGYSSAIYKEGATTGNYYPCNVKISITWEGKEAHQVILTENNITETITITKLVSRFTNYYSRNNGLDTFRVFYDIYEGRSGRTKSMCRIKWGIFDYPVDGQCASIKIDYENDGRVFRLKRD